MGSLFTTSLRWMPGVAAGFIASGACLAQTPDTVRIRYSQEVITDSLPSSSFTNWQRGLSKLTRLQIEEYRLWKISFTDFSLAGTADGVEDARFGLNLIYERKLYTSWSVLAEVTPQVVRYRPELATPLRTGMSVESQVAARYYYNLARRIRKGRSASNFSANYLSLALGTGLGRQGNGTPFAREGSRGEAVRATAALLYGLQRRLGRYGFVDAAVGLPLPVAPRLAAPALPLVITVRFGLALGR